ncbi:hypothetical protein D9M72_505300 [compost metagenome]
MGRSPAGSATGRAAARCRGRAGSAPARSPGCRRPPRPPARSGSCPASGAGHCAAPTAPCCARLQARPGRGFRAPANRPASPPRPAPPGPGPAPACAPAPGRHRQSRRHAGTPATAATWPPRRPARDSPAGSTRTPRSRGRRSLPYARPRAARPGRWRRERHSGVGLACLAWRPAHAKNNALECCDATDYGD